MVIGKNGYGIIWIIATNIMFYILDPASLKFFDRKLKEKNQNEFHRNQAKEYRKI
jgi:hypothetical protein